MGSLAVNAWMDISTHAPLGFGTRKPIVRSQGKRRETLGGLDVPYCNRRYAAVGYNEMEMTPDGQNATG
jgi:hypothetical protein